jgi:hypothetical protein
MEEAAAAEAATTTAGGEDPFTTLAKAWLNLRLSVRCPARVPTWDAILLTASSPEQALLYQWNLDHAKSRGTIASSTVALAIPDPLGHRIGSGGATLHAIRSLALQLCDPSPLLPQVHHSIDPINPPNQAFNGYIQLRYVARFFFSFVSLNAI